MSARLSSTTKTSEAGLFSYAEWRKTFLNYILRGAVIVGLFAVIAASIDTLPVLVAVYVISYVTILVVTLVPLPYRVRAISFLAVILAVAIANLLETGIRTDARLFLLAFVVMTAMLFGTRAGIIAIGVSLIPVFVTGYFILTRQYTIVSKLVGGNTELMTWFVAVVALLMIETIILTGLALLQRGFDRAMQQSQQLLVEVQAERATLEQRVEARTEQLRASADVGRAAVSILDTNHLLREVVNLITDRFGFYYTAIFLADSSQKWAVLREATGEAGRILKERHHQLAIGGQSMVGTAMKTRKTRIALDVGDEAVRFANPLLPDTRSEVALPLVVGTRVIGALDVQSTQVAAFDEASAAVLQSMADQIAIALSNTLQFQQAQSALQRTRQLYETSTAISNTDDAAGILNQLMTTAVAEADAAQILTYGPLDKAGQFAYLEVTASWAADNNTAVLPTGTRVLPEQIPAVPALSSEPFIVRDAADPALSPEQQHVLQALGVRAMLGYALVAGSQPVGLLLIGYREPRMFTPAETQPLQALAGQVAVTLRNQQLVQEQTLARQQLDEINRRLTGRVWKQYARNRGEAVRKVDVGPGAPPSARDADFPSELSAPVLIHGQEVGVLRLEDTAPDREWTPNERALVQAVAGEVAIAIETARLMEQTEQRADRERQVADISSRMFAANELETIVQIAAEELGRILRVSRTEVTVASAFTATASPAAARSEPA